MGHFTLLIGAKTLYTSENWFLGLTLEVGFTQNIIPGCVLLVNILLGGGFEHVLFSPLPGETIQFDKYFSNGLKPPTSCTRWNLELVLDLPRWHPWVGGNFVLTRRKDGDVPWLSEFTEVFH